MAASGQHPAGTGAASPAPPALREWAELQAFGEAGRFLLFVSYACPWSHRVLIARELSGRQASVEVVNVEPVMDEVGWRLGTGGHLLDVYRRLVPGFNERATVPLLVDQHTGTAVSNSSADLVRMIGDAHRSKSSSVGGLDPAAHAARLAEANDYVQEHVNKAAYRAGFANSPEGRRDATQALMHAMSLLDTRLGTSRYLVDDAHPTEPDWRLWTSLVRYEPAYRPFLLDDAAPALSAYPSLARFMEDLMQVPGIAATLRVQEIVTHYSARMRDRQA